MPHASVEIERHKRLWRCRRGTKELDIILTRFVERGFDDLSDDMQLLFDETLLATQDPDLDQWLMGKKEPQDAKVYELVKSIRRYIDF